MSQPTWWKPSSQRKPRGKKERLGTAENRPASQPDTSFQTTCACQTYAIMHAATTSCRTASIESRRQWSLAEMPLLPHLGRASEVALRNADD